MRYLKSFWPLRSVEDPAVIFVELGADGAEQRKIEVFQDGATGYCSPKAEVRGTFRAERNWPPVEEILADRSELVSFEIEAPEFETVWMAVTNSSR